MDGQINRTRGKGDKLTCARREIYVGENGSIYKEERNGIYNFSLLKLPQVLLKKTRNEGETYVSRDQLL